MALGLGLMVAGGVTSLAGNLFGARRRRKAAEDLKRRQKRRLGEIETAGEELYSNASQAYIA